MKHTIITTIIVLIASAFCFCAGMTHAVTHMQIQTTDRGHTAIVTLHDNVYVHDLCSYPLD